MCVYALLWLVRVSPHLLLLCEELIAEHGKAGHQGDILLEVYNTISISVQVLKNLVHFGLVAGLLLTKTYKEMANYFNFSIHQNCAESLNLSI